MLPPFHRDIHLAMQATIVKSNHGPNRVIRPMATSQHQQGELRSGGPRELQRPRSGVPSDNQHQLRRPRSGGPPKKKVLKQPSNHFHRKALHNRTYQLVGHLTHGHPEAVPNQAITITQTSRWEQNLQSLQSRVTMLGIYLRAAGKMVFRCCFDGC